MTGLAVYVGPDAKSELLDAVRDGGAAVVSPQDADAVVWYGGTPEDFAHLVRPEVRWVQLPYAGVESWIRAGVITADRLFTSAAGSYATSVAEHTLALLLTGSRRLHTLARASTWTAPAPAVLDGATVAILGAGGIGEALIRMLAPLGPQVIAMTRSGRPVPGAHRSVGPADLTATLQEADYVVLAAPATAQTQAMIGADQLDLMKRSAWLVNVGRGSLVDTDALTAALREARIAGAALDVTDPEPLPDGHPLWSEPRAIITSHSANSESLLLPQLATRVRENIARFEAGRPLLGLVEIGRGY